MYNLLLTLILHVNYLGDINGVLEPLFSVWSIGEIQVQNDLSHQLDIT